MKPQKIIITLSAAAALTVGILMQVGCTPDETTTIAPGGNPLTEAEVAPVKPTTLVGTEWVWRDRYVNTHYNVDDDLEHRLVFETDSTGNRHIHVYPTSTNPYEFEWPDVYPFTYIYDTVTGVCDWYNIPGNNHIVMSYNIDLDAFVDTTYSSRIYFRVK